MALTTFHQIFFRRLSNNGSTFIQGLYWILIALAGRTFYYLLELHFMGQVGAPKGVLGIYYDDSYFAPIRNLIHNGAYTPDERMPGLGIIYLPMALLFSTVTSLNILIWLQVLFSSLSLYYLAITARCMFKNDFMFYAVFYIFLLSPFTAISDSSPISESFCTSFLIFSVYHFQTALQKRKKVYFILSGVELTWTSFMRPAHFPLLMIFTILLIVYLLRNKVKPLLYVVLFLTPFFVGEGVWMVRNWIRYHKILPTLNSIYLSSCKDTYRFPIWQLERSWGLENWSIDWLIQKDNADISKENVGLPYIVYTSQYNADSMRAFKKFLNRVIIRYAYNYNGEAIYVDSVNNDNYTIIADRCHKYIESLKKEKPFQYYFVSRYRMAKDYLKLSIFGNFQEPYMKFFGTIMYYFVIVTGFAGIVLMAKYCRRFSPESLFAFIPLYSIFIHPVVLRLAQNRYFIPSYPFLVVCAAYLLYLLYCKAVSKSLFIAAKQYKR